MHNFEISMSDLKEILTDVFNKAVNSYYDLSETIVDDTIKNFITEKKFNQNSKFFVKGNNIVQSTPHITLMPSNYGGTTLIGGVSNYTETNTSSFVDYASYSNYNGYNNYCLANLATVNIVGTNPVGDS